MIMMTYYGGNDKKERHRIPFSTDLEHVVGGSAVLLAHGITSLFREVERLATNAPRGDDASAAL